MKNRLYFNLPKINLYAGMLLLMLGVSFLQTARADTFNDLLEQYTQNGAGPFSAEQGKLFWSQEHPDPKGGDQRRCSACHTRDLTQTGKHLKTGKRIKPMARSVNPERLSDTRKVKKWLRRNCKWTLGRECTDQEKGDILSFIYEFKN